MARDKLFCNVNHPIPVNIIIDNALEHAVVEIVTIRYFNCKLIPTQTIENYHICDTKNEILL